VLWSRSIKSIAIVAFCVCILSVNVHAEDTAKGWADTAEFSYVATNGNAESSSLGFKNTLTRHWDQSNMFIRIGAVRVETTTFNRSAVDGVVTETKTSETTAENYFAKGRYNRDISETFYWYGGAGWDRNIPSGIDSRWVLEGGLGNVWHDTDDLKFKTSYGLTYFNQNDVVTVPGLDPTFLGARFAWGYLNKLTKTTTFTNVFIVDLNADETSDWRADLDNGLAVTISERIALKVGLQFLYDNEPSFELVPNETGGGAPLPAVPYQLEELDTLLTISLVVNFT
jgi:putative salt-induced outer membrane protein YdiY